MSRRGVLCPLSCLVASALLQSAAAADSMSSGCKARITPDNITAKERAVIVLSSGSSLPYDAGKYQMCLDAGSLRYFLVSMTAVLNTTSRPLPLPMELGLCLPDSCLDSDIHGIMLHSMVRDMIPALNMIKLTSISATSPQLNLKPPNAGTWVAVAVVSCFILAVMFASWDELNQRTALGRSVLGRAHSTLRDNMTHLLETGEAHRSSILPNGMSRASSEPAPEPSVATSPVPQRSSPPMNLPRQDLAEENQQPRARGVLSRVAHIFSLFGDSGTLPKVAESPPYKPTDSLNGLRVISMFWVVLGHTFLMPKGIAGYSNNQDILSTPLQQTGVAENSVAFQFVLAAQISVDTFFFLSGFLLSLLTVRELRASRGKTQVFMAIVLRYIRLTPSLALAMLVYYQICPYLASGPFSPRYQDSIFRRCDGSWWSELTYTLNFVPFDSDKVCMGWTWYLGDDMIFFIISIALLPLYFRFKWLGWTIVGALSFASCAVTVWLCLHFKLSPYVFNEHYQDYSYWAYSKPYSRIPAYFVGLVAAWVLDDFETVRGITRENRVHTLMSRILAASTFLVCLAVMLFIVFIPATDFGNDKDKWDRYPAISAMYLTFSRPLWSLAWAVTTILCYYDYLPLVNGFLAHRMWAPFARLTYGAYLCHPIVIKLTAGNETQYYNFSTMDLFYRWLGNTVLAYGGALVLWCLVERPTMTFTSQMLKKKRPDRSPNTRKPPIER